MDDQGGRRVVSSEEGGAPSLLECAHTVIEILPRLSRTMRRDLRIHSAGLFTEPQFRVMASLYREEERCLSGLATSLGVSLPTMSRLVQGLESRGLVCRHRSEEDRRRVVLSLTPEGVAAYEALLRRTERHLVDWLSPLTPEERAEVVRVFNRLDQLISTVDLEAYYLKGET